MKLAAGLGRRQFSRPGGTGIRVERFTHLPNGQWPRWHAEFEAKAEIRHQQHVLYLSRYPTVWLVPGARVTSAKMWSWADSTTGSISRRLVPARPRELWVEGWAYACRRRTGPVGSVDVYLDDHLLGRTTLSRSRPRRRTGAGQPGPVAGEVTFYECSR